MPESNEIVVLAPMANATWPDTGEPITAQSILDYLLNEFTNHAIDVDAYVRVLS